MTATEPDLETEELPSPGRYRHFKGAEYDVLATGRHSETGELVVVYRAADGSDAVWVRPLAMFVEAVRASGRVVRRFEPLEG